MSHIVFSYVKRNKTFEEEEYLSYVKKIKLFSQATPLYPLGHRNQPIEDFPQIDRKLSVHKNMNWKINTNRRYILNPSNRRKKTSIDLKI